MWLDAAHEEAGRTRRKVPAPLNSARVSLSYSVGTATFTHSFPFLIRATTHLLNISLYILTLSKSYLLMGEIRCIMKNERSK